MRWLRQAYLRLLLILSDGPKFVAVCMILAGILAFFVNSRRTELERDGVPEIAKVSGLGLNPARWGSGRVSVWAQDANGVTGVAVVRSANAENCSVGSEVKVLRIGLALKVFPETCAMVLTRQQITPAPL